MKKLIVAVIISSAARLHAGAQVLETEDSRPLNASQVETGGSVEYQASNEGYELALPLSVEYGLSKRFTFLFEPVPFTAIRPKTGRYATGLGDLEMTLFYQLIKEIKNFPAI